MSQPSPLALLLAASLTAPVVAQLPPGPTHPKSILSVPYGLHSGPVERCEALRATTPKHYRDLVVLRDDQLGRVHAIGSWNYVEPLAFPGQVSDFVVVPGGNPVEPSCDALVITDATSGGVTFAWWTAPQVVAFQAVSMGAWQGAGRLTIAATAGGHDVLGVAADGQTLLRGAIAGIGFSHVSAFNVGRPVLGTALGDRNGDGELETFCLTDLGVLILTRLGGFVAMVPSHHPGGVMAAVGSRVAWLKRNPADNGWLLTFVAGAPTFPPTPIDLHGLDFTPVGMSEANGDQMGELDLLITQSTTQEAMLVRFETDGAGGLQVARQDIALSAQPELPGTSITCRAAVTDIDGDGYSDVMAMVLGAIGIVRGIADGQTHAQRFGGEDGLLHETTFFEQADGLELALVNDAALFGNHSHVQVSLWIQNWQEDVEDQSPLGVNFEILPWTSAGQGLPLPMWTGHTSQGYHHLEIVFIDFNGDPGPVFTVAGFCHSEPAAAEPHLPEDYIAEHMPLFADYGYQGSQSQPILKDQGDRILVGGHVRSARMPPAKSFPKPPPTSQTATTTAVQ